ncbi:MAG: outer membrane lipoprotein-sorting protein [Candidatus Sulfotelmatobacter sp.]
MRGTPDPKALIRNPPPAGLSGGLGRNVWQAEAEQEVTQSNGQLERVQTIVVGDANGSPVAVNVVKVLNYRVVIRTSGVCIAMNFLRRVVMLSRSRKFGRYREARWANRAFGAIQAAIALLVLLSLVHPSRTFAANPDLETVLTASRQRIEKLDYRVTGRLTQVEGDGKHTSYKFVAKAHWFPDGLRLLCEISGPGSEKTSLLLHMSLSGHVTISALLPGEKTASVLPFEHWNDPLLGTDFSYEDMVESQFFWKSQGLLAPEKYGARDCFVLKSTAGSQDRTYYDSVTSWIDRTILYPVHVVKTLRGTGQQKEFIYYGLRQVGGVWTAMQAEVKLLGKPGSSILAIERGSPKANLGRKDFDISQANAQQDQVK